MACVVCGLIWELYVHVLYTARFFAEALCASCNTLLRIGAERRISIGTMCYILLEVVYNCHCLPR